MKKIVLSIPFTAGCIALAGCSAAGGANLMPSHAPSASHSPSTETCLADPSLKAGTQACLNAGMDSSTTTSPTPDTNVRGDITNQVGTPFTLDDNGSGQTYATVTVEKISVDPKCTAPYARPNNAGHTVVLDARVTTSSDATPTELSDVLNPFEFAVIGSDGVTHTGLIDTAMCFPVSQQMPINMNPGSKYRGKIILNSPISAGTLVYRPTGFSNGVEWRFGGGQS